MAQYIVPITISVCLEYSGYAFVSREPCDMQPLTFNGLANYSKGIYILINVPHYTI